MHIIDDAEDPAGLNAQRIGVPRAVPGDGPAGLSTIGEFAIRPMLFAGNRHHPAWLPSPGFGVSAQFQAAGVALGLPRMGIPRARPVRSLGRESKTAQCSGLEFPVLCREARPTLPSLLPSAGCPPKRRNQSPGRKGRTASSPAFCSLITHPRGNAPGEISRRPRMRKGNSGAPVKVAESDMWVVEQAMDESLNRSKFIRTLKPGIDPDAVRVQLNKTGNVKSPTVCSTYCVTPVGGLVATYEDPGGVSVRDLLSKHRVDSTTRTMGRDRTSSSSR